jgi:hypothetical protein
MTWCLTKYRDNIHPEDGSGMFLRNIGILQQTYNGVTTQKTPLELALFYKTKVVAASNITA